MKKFLLNVSKKNIPKIFLIFLVLLLMILFSSAKTVYAASGSSSNLYECEDFNIENIYNDGPDCYICIHSKLRSGSQYAQNMNFTSISFKDLNNNIHNYSLTLVNGNSGMYYYFGEEKYIIDNFIDNEYDDVLYAQLISLTNSSNTYNVSNGEVFITFINESTIKTAECYAYIYFTDDTCYEFGTYTNPAQMFSYYNSAKIFFNLYVDGVGEIDPEYVKSLKFQFKDKKNNWVVINSSFASSFNPSEFNKKWNTDYDINYDIEWNEGFLGTRHYIEVDENMTQYYFVCTDPSFTVNLSSDFNVGLTAFDNYIYSDVLEKARNDNAFNDWESGRDNFKYLISMEHCPKLNKGATKSNNNVSSFAVLQFSYLDANGSLTAATLYNASQTDNQPVYVIYDEVSGESIPYTVDPETGELIDLTDEGYYVDNAGNLRDPNNEIVGAEDRNHNKTNPDSISFWDRITSLFGSFGKWFKTGFTVVLLVIGIILFIKVLSIISNFTKSKSNNVNINVSTRSSRRKKK